MKLKHEAVIKADVDFVWAVFDDPDNLPRWQPTLESVTHRKGQRGERGAVTELVYNENGKKIVMTETVTERRSPDFTARIYDTARIRMLTVNHFEAIDDQTTRFAVYSNTSFKGVMRALSLFLAKSIRERAEDDIQRFKLFVETEAASTER